MTVATPLDVAERIAGGEDSQTEFKAPRIEGRRIAGTDGNEESFAGEIVALANEAGGVILIGVGDDRSLAGYSPEQAEAAADWAMDLARDHVVPVVSPIVRTHCLDTHEGPAYVVAVHVDRGLVHRTAGGRWYRRVGRTSVELDEAGVEHLLRERAARCPFDESPVPDSSLDDLDDALLRRTFAQPATLEWEQLLTNHRVLTDQRPARVTFAGLLAFGSEPQAKLPQAMIRAVCYRGTQMDGDTVDQTDLTGPAGTQVDGAVSFVDRNMRHAALKYVGRQERVQFHLGAVMEAVVNAVAHRDYAIVGSRIRLLVFRDRVEVISPGRLPNTLDLESMRYRQYTRNQLLVGFLARLQTPEGRRYIEERGEGVERIIRLSTQLSGREPELRLDGDELRVTIWGADGGG